MRAEKITKVSYEKHEGRRTISPLNKALTADEEEEAQSDIY